MIDRALQFLADRVNVPDSMIGLVIAFYLLLESLKALALQSIALPALLFVYPFALLFRRQMNDRTNRYFAGPSAESKRLYQQIKSDLEQTAQGNQ